MQLGLPAGALKCEAQHQFRPHSSAYLLQVIGRGRKSPDPKIPPAQKSVIPCHSKAVSRTVLIVSTSATFDQWCASAKETAEVLRPGFAEFVPCSRCAPTLWML